MQHHKSFSHTAIQVLAWLETIQLILLPPALKEIPESQSYTIWLVLILRLILLLLLMSLLLKCHEDENKNIVLDIMRIIVPLTSLVSLTLFNPPIMKDYSEIMVFLNTNIKILACFGSVLFAVH
jgi:nitrogen fixation/metabolism regulation signal transduction histidine kinase